MISCNLLVDLGHSEGPSCGQSVRVQTKPKERDAMPCGCQQLLCRVLHCLRTARLPSAKRESALR